jgi:predicted ester cyclase
VGQGDKVVIRWTMGGTQLGPFGPIPPTGKRISWSGITICRIADGKVIDDRGEEDSLSVMRQLGVVPTPEQVAAPA